VSPRQSPSSAIFSVMSLEADFPAGFGLLFIVCLSMLDSSRFRQNPMCMCGCQWQEFCEGKGMSGSRFGARLWGRMAV
jgi:hypothetical protein